MNDRVQTNPSVVYQELEGEMVLVHLDTNAVYTLNETGARFWELLSKGLDPASIHDEIAREFEVDPQVLNAEIERLVDQLAAAELIYR